ncbi:hypothetical protein RO3G_16515 [Rhizopus delemar RA 99-880]|uniref:Uncharacterized protein n=1 Tax=Rhizopus delemar (strain RA 99-880 / ATCC MYA-4621 / FGSC 9543 / NRRL 43880) TaxID=246409 RepID=I1CTM4_RHIO9|nr:hypothetical protein RO3G_16515 [Rhizopus delemar RA 99-880]|eukprot:EIE91804.1 hypothetical protein RO3G_16515 [Rhizopus delemar RA 99-880]
MSMHFFYADDQGHVVDEHRVKPMELSVDEEPFAIETISSRTHFLQNKLSKPTLHSAGDERNHVDVYMICSKELYHESHWVHKASVRL